MNLQSEGQIHKFPKPAWCKPMTTGLGGLAYPLERDDYLVLLSSEKLPPNGCEPDRLWPFFLTEHDRRNIPAEKEISSQQQYNHLLERTPFGLEDILCVREKDLVALLHLLEDTFEQLVRM